MCIKEESVGDYTYGEHEVEELLYYKTTEDMETQITEEELELAQQERIEVKEQLAKMVEIPDDVVIEQLPSNAEILDDEMASEYPKLTDAEVRFMENCTNYLVPWMALNHVVRSFGVTVPLPPEYTVADSLEFVDQVGTGTLRTTFHTHFSGVQLEVHCNEIPEMPAFHDI